jgi:hypothetical protein
MYIQLSLLQTLWHEVKFHHPHFETSVVSPSWPKYPQQYHLISDDSRATDNFPDLRGLISPSLPPSKPLVYYGGLFFFFFLISKNFIEKTKYTGRILGKEYKKAQIEQ